MRAPELRASKACDDLIKRHEDEAGFLAGKCSHLTAYKCPAGIWTIGWGCTGPGISEGATISAEYADALYLEKRMAVEAELRPLLGSVDLTQGQWDALVSLSYNFRGGPRRLAVQAPKLWRHLVSGQKELAAAEFLDINKADGKPLAGLTRRRQAEAKLFLS